MLDCETARAKFLSAGLFASQDEWIHPKRRLGSYEIIYVLKGSVPICENDVDYHVMPDEVLLLQPGLTHFGLQYGSEVEFYWIHFQSFAAPTFKYFAPNQKYEIKSQLKRLLHIVSTPGYFPSSRDAALILLLNELCFQFGSAPSGRELLSRISEYTRINSDKKLSVASVAQHFGYTPGYISKFFKAEYHTGLKKYIEQERINYAKDLLLSTAMPVKEIAFRMGYTDEKLFIKFFTYHECVSPSKYRNFYFNTHMNSR